MFLKKNLLGVFSENIYFWAHPIVTWQIFQQPYADSKKKAKLQKLCWYLYIFLEILARLRWHKPLYESLFHVLKYLYLIHSSSHCHLIMCWCNIKSIKMLHKISRQFFARKTNDNLYTNEIFAFLLIICIILWRYIMALPHIYKKTAMWINKIRYYNTPRNICKTYSQFHTTMLWYVNWWKEFYFLTQIATLSYTRTKFAYQLLD